MPALDFTAWPSKPTAPPAASTGAPRPTARTSAPKAGAKTGSKSGPASGADGEFGQLVDRMADAPDEGKTASRGVRARGSRDSGVIGEESAAEPRAKGDADEASGTANDSPAANASVASNPTPFPWTLPLSPSLWNIGQLQDDSASAGDAGDAVEDAGVASAMTGAIANGAAGACVATLPGAGADAESSTFTVPVDTPVAIDPGSLGAGANGAGAAAGTRGTGEMSKIDPAAVTGAAAAGGSEHLEHEVIANVARFSGDQLTNNGFVGDANATGGQYVRNGSASGKPTLTVPANGTLDAQASAPSNLNDSTLFAPSATDTATMAGAVDEAAATTAAGQINAANAAIDAPAPGDQAREQALVELQRALEAARANGSSPAAKSQSPNGDASFVIQTGTSAAAADAAAASAAAALDAAATANAGDSASALGTAAGTAGTDPAIASASARTSRSHDKQNSDELDIDSTLTSASSWAAAAAAKYAEAAGAGTSGGDTLDSRANADAAANAALAGRAGDAASLAPVGFDARVVAASRADQAAQLPDGWAGESAILTTAAPEEQAAQIVKSMRLHWRGSTGEATLRLQPDHLGQVFVSVRVDQGTVSATVRAETPAAQQWIQQHQQQLRDALDAQGLRVAQFEVTHNPDDRPRRDQEQDQQDSAGRRGSRARTRRADDDRRFEIHL